MYGDLVTRQNSEGRLIISFKYVCSRETCNSQASNLEAETADDRNWVYHTVQRGVMKSGEK